ncbi:MAG TPA: type II toxin-antitoxin system PemK/MazF family toxin, partial [Candidatus Methylacidiphilales bacterium]
MDPAEPYALYLADLNPVPGRDLRRVVPVVVVSRAEMNAALPTVVVCPLAGKNPPGWRSRAAVRVAGREQA